MHIAMYIGSLQLGGAEHVMVNLAESLYARGWRVTLVTTYLAEEEFEVPHGLWRRLDKDGTPEQSRLETGSPSDRTDGLHVVYAVTPEEKHVPVEVSVRQEQSGAVQRCTGSGSRSDGIWRVFSGIASGETGGRLQGLMHRVKRLEEIWEDIKPDVILSFIGKNNFMALWSARKYRIPVVVSVRATPIVEYPTLRMRLAANLLFSHAAAVAVQSEAAGTWFSGAVSRKAVVMPNAVGSDYLIKRARLQESSNGLFKGPGEERIIAAVGRIDANKNFGLLVRAAARLVNEAPEGLPPFRIVLYGDGEDREKIIREAGDLGISDRVTLMGQVKGIADELRKADIYCLTSDREGMPNTLIEAMCLELPCIATDCVYGGIGQIVKDRENALVVKPGDEQGMAAGIKRLLLDPVEAARLGKNAGKLREKYVAEHVTDLWEQLLSRVANKG